MTPDPEPPADDDFVDDVGMESFPASDPPPFWARPEPARAETDRQAPSA